MTFIDIKLGPMPDVNVQNLVFGNHPVTREVSLSGEGIDVLDRLEDPESFVGPASYGSVINFNDMCVKEGMRGYVVPESERWSGLSRPPNGVTILGFEDPRVQECVKKISEIATDDFYQNREACQRYYDLNEEIFIAIARHSNMDIRDLHDVSFLGLIRAGVVAGQMLGISAQEQVLIQTKRLHIKNEKRGDISIGITHQDPKKIKQLDGKDWLIADPAGATLSSVEAVLIDCINRGVKPNRVLVWNTVVSHQGAKFAINAVGALGVDVELVAGGYAPGMNENYYLQTAEGKPSVRDAGNALNGFLPEGLRLNGVVKGNGFGNGGPSNNG